MGGRSLALLGGGLVHQRDGGRAVLQQPWETVGDIVSSEQVLVQLNLLGRSGGRVGGQESTVEGREVDRV